ncbi:MAG TPA: hypothetical protein VGF55_17385 [Gemmataceae bacterium]|jgi:hypothetical protein
MFTRTAASATALTFLAYGLGQPPNSDQPPDAGARALAAAEADPAALLDWAVGHLRLAYPTPDDPSDRPAADRRFEVYAGKLRAAVNRKVRWPLKVVRADRNGVTVGPISKPVPADDLKVFAPGALAPGKGGARRGASTYVLAAVPPRGHPTFPAPPPEVADTLREGSPVVLSGVIEAFELIRDGGEIGGPVYNGAWHCKFRVTVSGAKVEPAR